ncbi:MULTISPECIES: response regulator [Clostridium]|uniref:Transcriptional regulatory protein n=1 Tax=Clostridium saccharoperbutylacetonicum N1-4(HMT) TaxID=931276 RepID=M1N1K3_9CLOT|nr:MULTISPECIES: response regulator [Clostridium]AGF57362.1 transcriptional regulatory protein MalR [Clostridium saccharoperbutylacetonicum N1-4(HMT)]AQR96055.1 transcriptional regulatory protein DcuR [Clostridium saccharoperbutylacetonicum]NRT61875.1 two-component system CitB family response regulator/CitB family two-component system response regulator MalR [Clostridium saccharoperbutylacetonicum]NSB25201.1 two-component system CitB family response regulator/CitB family two-component system re
MIKTMIVEDDPMVRDINSKFLNKVKGFTLKKAAANLTEAKEFILQNEIDLILLDVYLPNENGIDFLKWLRSNEIASDVILITADKSVERVREAFRYGGVDYLIKPFTFERFNESLSAFREKLNSYKSNETLEQIELDKLILNSKSSEIIEDELENNLEKGLNKYTYNSIINELNSTEAEYVTTEEVSEKLRIAKVTVRKYLDYMSKQEKLEKIIEYGRVGRPLYKYKIKNL